MTATRARTESRATRRPRRRATTRADEVGVELAVRRHEGLARLVALAHDAGTVRELVERLAEEQLDEAALLLDDEQLLEPAGEVPDDVRAPAGRASRA